MSDMYGPRRIIFHNKGKRAGIMAIAGKQKGASGGSYCPLGRYTKRLDGRIDVFMVNDPTLSRGQKLKLVGRADNLSDARRMIFKAAKANPNMLMARDHKVDEKGNVT